MARGLRTVRLLLYYWWLGWTTLDVRAQAPDTLIDRVVKPMRTVSISIEPKRPVTRCSGERQNLTCQIVDYDMQLSKNMQIEQGSRGYGGYVEYLIYRKSTRSSAEAVVADLHVNYPQELMHERQFALTNLTIFDKGEYFCNATWHGIGGDTRWSSQALQLNVYDCIVLETQTLEAGVGDIITMQCIDAEADVKWFKNDELLDEANKTTPVGGSRLAGVPGIRTISIQSIESAGIYTCKAIFEDTQQIFTKNTEVRIKTAPTTPININPERLSPTSVILHWEQKPLPNRFINAEPTFYTIFYRTIDTETFSSKTVLKHAEVMLTNLKPNTVYFVRIQAENELGTSVSGSRIVVTPAASELISIDKRLLMLMTEHAKVLDQDLRSITNVLKDLVPAMFDMNTDGRAPVPEETATRQPNRRTTLSPRSGRSSRRIFTSYSP